MRDISWTGDYTLTVDGTRFELCSPLQVFDAELERFAVIKNARSTRHLTNQLKALEPRRIVELGVFAGGSTALIAAQCDPEMMVAIELDPNRLPGLDAHLRRYDGRVQAHHGVDQADAATLEGIVDRAFVGPLDLVLDDASHRYAETRASFELLYPRLRPGGLYIIEDWKMPAVQILVCELVAAFGTGLAGELVIRQDAVTIRRGRADLGGFSVGERVAPDLAGVLAARAESWTDEKYDEFMTGAFSADTSWFAAWSN